MKNAILRRLQFTYLSNNYPRPLVRALFLLVNGFVSMAILALIAMLTKAPLIFPSLGPSAVLLFLTPRQPSAAPRNVLFGHAIGIICGFAALHIFGLASHGSVLVEGVLMSRIFAAGLSLGLTGALMALFQTPHPPAGATTLIIALGFMTNPLYLAAVEIAVGLLILQAVVINRLAGIEYPIKIKT